MALLQSSYHLFATRPHSGPELSSFLPVLIDEVGRLLAALPAKMSPLDVLPCSLLKECADVFAPAITRRANLSLQTLQISRGAATVEEGGARQIVASKLQTYPQLVNCVQDSGEDRAGAIATSHDQFEELQHISVCL